MAEGITYIPGDATLRYADGRLVIAHITSDRGQMGAGFAAALMRRYPNVADEYFDWSSSDRDFRLGENQIVEVATGVWAKHGSLWIANMVAQHGYNPQIFKGESRPPIRHEMLKLCLGQVAAHCLEFEASVQMPFIGTGLAGGMWENIEPIVLSELVDKGVDVTVRFREDMR